MDYALENGINFFDTANYILYSKKKHLKARNYNWELVKNKKCRERLF